MYPGAARVGQAGRGADVRRDAAAVGRHRPGRRRHAARRSSIPALTKEFPADAQVAPTAIVLKAADGFEFHNQLFLPKDLKPGEQRPAIVFVHGGPVRQMLLGYHYMEFYSHGVRGQRVAGEPGLRRDVGQLPQRRRLRQVVPQRAEHRRARQRRVPGRARGGKYLQTRADVDPTRVGIWGLSYGGVLTSQALARNSDIFVAGVDMAGVHLWGSSLDPTDVSYQSSAISAIDTWKSPVLLWHGDDDRNVALLADDRPRAAAARAQRAVRADRHAPTTRTRRCSIRVGSRRMRRMQDFLRRNVWEKKATP